MSSLKIKSELLKAEKLTPKEGRLKRMSEITKTNDCEHPIRSREYYNDSCYKCWECNKIITK